MKDKSARMDLPVRILAVETSCDETAVAIVENGRRLLANCIYSQVPTHKLYGGVVPEIASRAHLEKISPLVSAALDEAGLCFEDVDAVAVTFGPGLVGALLVGVSYAKGLSFALGKPLIAVNHIEGHIYSNVFAHPDFAPPYVCLVVSGGHSHLFRVSQEGEYELIGCTQDDAAGEAFDKAARVLGLPYPGGPLLDKAAALGDGTRFMLSQPRVEGRYDYSFSGPKTAFINLCHQMTQKGEELPVADLAASFRAAVVRQLLDKAMLAMSDHAENALALAGGVSANSLLRSEAERLCKERGYRLFVPDLKYCGDNAAMIGAAAFPKFGKADFAGLDLNAVPSLRMR